VKSLLLFLLPVYLFFVSEVSYARYAAIVIDAETGSILHEVESNQPWYPASLTKVMTLYMTFEAVKSGQLQLGSLVKVSDHASRQPKSKLGLRRGEKLTVRDAILAVITRSANDAAVVLAEAVGGNEDNFAAMMTARARSLGMNNSRFMNATGLPNNWQITTSRDLALLAWKIRRDFPSFYPYFSAHEFNYKGRTMRGINAFVAKYPGAEGMKTGFTCGSGYNLMASAHQNGKRLIGVVMGGMSSKERYQLMTRIMDNAFAKAYTNNPGMNVTSLRPYSTSVPPYQLTCGNGASSHTIASNPSIGQGSETIKRPKHTQLVRKATSSGKPKSTHLNKTPVKAKRLSKTKTVAKTKSVRTNKSSAPRKISTSSKAKPITKTTRLNTAKKSEAIKKSNTKPSAMAKSSKIPQ
jgi:D-alanyl-D-alanine carboxypeptidase